MLAKVAAILRQIRPDLPIPVTTTLPLHSPSNLMVLQKFSSRRSSRDRSPSNLDVQHLSGTGQNGFLVHETELPFTISSICFTAPINFSKSFNCKEFGPSLKA